MAFEMSRIRIAQSSGVRTESRSESCGLKVSLGAMFRTFKVPKTQEQQQLSDEYSKTYVEYKSPDTKRVDEASKKPNWAGEANVCSTM